MSILRKYTLTFISLLAVYFSFSQNKDSILQILKTEQHDTVRISSLFELAGTVYLSNPDTAILICEEILELAKKNNSESNIAESYGWLGYLYGNKGKIDKALEYNLKAVDFLENSIHKESLANTYINIAGIYDDKGEIKKTLDYYTKALDVHNKVNNKKGMAVVYSNMAYVYSNIGEIEKAVDLWNQSLNMQLEINDKKGIATSYINLGSVFSLQNDQEKALEYYLKSLDLYKEVNDKSGEGIALKNIGSNYFKNNNYNKAEKYFLQSLEIFKEISETSKIAELYLDLESIKKVNDEYDGAKIFAEKALENYTTIGEVNGIATANLKLSFIYCKQEKYKKGLKHAETAYEISTKLGYPQEIMLSAQQLKKIYIHLNNYKKAFQFYDIEIIMRDSITNERNYKSLIKQESKYTYQSQLEAKNAEIEKAHLENKIKQKQKNISYIAIIFLLILIVFIFINSRKLKNHYKNELNLLNEIKEIDDDYKKILDANIDVVFMINSSGKLLYFNKQLNAIFGQSPKEVIGRSFTEFIPKSEKAKYLNKLKEVFLRKQILPFDTYVIHKNGKPVPVEINGRVIKYKREIVGVGTIKDITKRKKTNEEIKKLSFAVNQSSVSTVITDTEGNIEFVNPFFTKITGYTFDEAIGKNPSILKSGETTKDEYKKLWNIISSGKTWRGEFLNIKKNGLKYWEKATISPIKNEKGKIINYIAIKEDITEFKKNMQALKDSEQKFKSIINNMTDIYYRTDKDKNLTLVSPSALDALGYEDMNEIIGKNVPNTFYYNPKDSEKMPAALKEKAEVKSFYVVLKHKTGRPIDFETNTKIIFDETGKPIGTEGILRNITERKKHELQILKAKQEAESANRLKSEFLANMSHEIRTPMNAIIGFSSILQNRLKDEKERSFIDKIAQSGNNLLELIDDILDLSKIEAGQLKIQKQATNIYNIVNEIPVIFSETSERNLIPIKLNIEKNIPNYLLLDTLRLRQILLNLVGNAMKFTEEGFVSVAVKTNKGNSKGKINLTIEVKDTGIGIPDNQLGIIFQSFRQVEGQDSRSFGGTGLGLAITKRLVELMNGTISARSKVGEGSVFTIELFDVDIMNIDSELINKEYNNDFKFVKSKILHVEDIEYNRQIIQLFLENESVELTEVKTGKEALSLLKSYIPDIILMDIQLPGQSGYEITKIIKQIDSLKHIPVIAVTANATSEEVEKYSHIFDDYLTKPLSKETLLKTLKKYLDFTVTESNYKSKNISFINELKKENKSVFTQELKTCFNNELNPIHKQISEVLSVDEIRIFSQKINIIAEKYNIKGLKIYSETIYASIKNFNIKKINDLLKDFNEIIRIIYEK